MKLCNAKIVWIGGSVIGYVSQNWQNDPGRVSPISRDWTAHDMLDGTILPRTYSTAERAARAIYRKWAGTFRKGEHHEPS